MFSSNISASSASSASSAGGISLTDFLASPEVVEHMQLARELLNMTRLELSSEHEENSLHVSDEDIIFDSEEKIKQIDYRVEDGYVYRAHYASRDDISKDGVKRNSSIAESDEDFDDYIAAIFHHTAGHGSEGRILSFSSKKEKSAEFLGNEKILIKVQADSEAGKNEFISIPQLILQHGMRLLNNGKIEKSILLSALDQLNNKEHDFFYIGKRDGYRYGEIPSYDAKVEIVPSEICDSQLLNIKKTHHLNEDDYRTFIKEFNCHYPEEMDKYNFLSSEESREKEEKIVSIITDAKIKTDNALLLHLKEELHQKTYNYESVMKTSEGLEDLYGSGDMHESLRRYRDMQFFLNTTNMIYQSRRNDFKDRLKTIAEDFFHIDEKAITNATAVLKLLDHSLRDSYQNHLKNKNNNISRIEFPELKNKNPTEQDIITASLRKGNGIICGEDHTESAALQFLISHIDELTKQGCQYIFLEDLCPEVFQSDLNEFNTTGKISSRLQMFLDFTDARKRINADTFPEHPTYSVQNLITEARKHGMEIHGLGSLSTDNMSSDADRTEYFNYVASRQIENVAGGHQKFVALVGSAHVDSYRPTTTTPPRNITGIAQSTKATSVVFSEYTPGTYNYHTEVDSGSITHPNDPLRPVYGGNFVIFKETPYASKQNHAGDSRISAGSPSRPPPLNLPERVETPSHLRRTPGQRRSSGSRRGSAAILSGSPGGDSDLASILDNVLSGSSPRQPPISRRRSSNISISSPSAQIPSDSTRRVPDSTSASDTQHSGLRGGAPRGTDGAGEPNTCKTDASLRTQNSDDTPGGGAAASATVTRPSISPSVHEPSRDEKAFPESATEIRVLNTLQQLAAGVSPGYRHRQGIDKTNALLRRLNDITALACMLNTKEGGELYARLCDTSPRHLNELMAQRFAETFIREAEKCFPSMGFGLVALKESVLPDFLQKQYLHLPQGQNKDMPWLRATREICRHLDAQCRVPTQKSQYRRTLVDLKRLPPSGSLSEADKQSATKLGNRLSQYDDTRWKQKATELDDAVRQRAFRLRTKQRAERQLRYIQEEERIKRWADNRKQRNQKLDREAARHLINYSAGESLAYQKSLAQRENERNEREDRMSADRHEKEMRTQQERRQFAEASRHIGNAMHQAASADLQRHREKHIQEKLFWKSRQSTPPVNDMPMGSDGGSFSGSTSSLHSGSAGRMPPVSGTFFWSDPSSSLSSNGSPPSRLGSAVSPTPSPHRPEDDILRRAKNAEIQQKIHAGNAERYLTDIQKIWG